MVGPVVERLVGIRTFLIFYIASGLAGTALSLWFHPLTTAAGASGSIIGLYGVLLAMMFERPATRPLTLDEQSPFVSRPLLHVHLQSAVATDRLDAALRLVRSARRQCRAHRRIPRRVPVRLGRRPPHRVAVPTHARLRRRRGNRHRLLRRLARDAARGHRRQAGADRSLYCGFAGDGAVLAARQIARRRPTPSRGRFRKRSCPAFSRERAKLDALGRVPPEQERTLADLRQYLLLREAYWRQRAAAAAAPTTPHCGSWMPPTMLPTP